MNPDDRVMQARMAAHALHAQRDPRVTTEAARRVFRGRFEREVVEAARERGEELSDPAEIARRAQHALKAHMTRLALKSAQARRR
jgi:hypothetical protein